MGKTLVVGSLSNGSGGVNAEYPICGLNRRRMGCYHAVMDRLNRKAFGGLLVLLLVMAGLLFLAAGALAYWQAWVFFLVFGASAPAITVYLVRYCLVPFVF